MQNKFCIMSNDGRYVTQTGFTPALTDNANLAYTWENAESANARLEAYLKALKNTGILALAVFPLRIEYKPGALFGKVVK